MNTLCLAFAQKWYGLCCKFARYHLTDTSQEVALAQVGISTLMGYMPHIPLLIRSMAGCFKHLTPGATLSISEELKVLLHCLPEPTEPDPFNIPVSTYHFDWWHHQSSDSAKQYVVDCDTLPDAMAFHWTQVNARRIDTSDYLSREVTDALAMRMGPRPETISAEPGSKKADCAHTPKMTDIPIWRSQRPGPMLRGRPAHGGPTANDVRPTPLEDILKHENPTSTLGRVPTDCKQCTHWRKLTMDAIVSLKENRRHLQTIQQFALEGYETSDSQLQSFFLLERIRAANPKKIPTQSTLARYSLPDAFRTDNILPPPPVNNSSNAAEYAHQVAAKYSYETFFRPRNSNKTYPDDLVPGATQPSRQQETTMEIDSIIAAQPNPAPRGPDDIIMQDSSREVRAYISLYIPTEFTYWCL
jgi:hypothetical protein